MEAATNRRSNATVGEMPSLPVAVSAPVVPVVLTLVLTAGVALAGVVRDVGQLEAYALYGVANLMVLGGLFVILSSRARRAVAPFETPSVREFGAAGLAFVAGLVAYQTATVVNGVLGTPMEGMSYTLSDPVAVVLIVFGAVVVAPVAEEVLFRGLLLGYLLDRGYTPVAAGAAVVVAFALIHLPNFGIGGAVFILLWGPFPTALRLWFDNLTGAWLMHAANNLFAYVLVAGVLA
jgi:membrane protease YdiL (CAAX protease family)